MASSDTREALSRTILLCRQQILGTNYPSDNAIADALLATRVAIVSDAANLASPACETSISVLVRLLNEYGCSVTLVLPDTTCIAPEPRFRDAIGLVERVRQVAADGVPGPIVERATAVRGEAIVFVMGDTAWSGDAEHVWRLTGSEWTGVIGGRGGASRWMARWSLGGMVAAVAASAEPFKYAMRSFARVLDAPMAIPELLDPVTSASVKLASGPAPTRVLLGPLDAISGGAIVQAALDTLLRLPEVSADVRVFEPEFLELSNLNRYQISRHRDLTPPRRKVDTLADAATPTVAINGIAERFDPDVSRASLPVRPRVVVGADNLQARWWLGVGATADFMAMVSDHTPNAPCAGCVHPFDDGVRDVIPTISFVSYWAGLLLATRLIASAHREVHVARGSVFEVNALRLDSPTAFRSYSPTRHPACPLRCDAR
jgi:hypothetical protein